MEATYKFIEKLKKKKINKKKKKKKKNLENDVHASALTLQW
jgi:hypothetical protein